MFYKCVFLRLRGSSSSFFVRRRSISARSELGIPLRTVGNENDERLDIDYVHVTRHGGETIFRRVDEQFSVETKWLQGTIW